MCHICALLCFLLCVPVQINLYALAVLCGPSYRCYVYYEVMLCFCLDSILQLDLCFSADFTWAHATLRRSTLIVLGQNTLMSQVHWLLGAACKTLLVNSL